MSKTVRSHADPASHARGSNARRRSPGRILERKAGRPAPQREVNCVAQTGTRSERPPGGKGEHRARGVSEGPVSQGS